MRFTNFLVAGFVCMGGAVVAQNAPSLRLPVECTLGDDCVIQQFVDHDPTEGVRDFGCGTASYDGHKGTDFRVTDSARFNEGVPVLAAADGTVLGIRDEMVDKQVRVAADHEAVKGRECGNGIVVDHGFGWQTQYCHMRLGSVTVQKRQRIKAGDILGMVGLSGRTQFPHLHLTVRHRNVVIDPFTSQPQNETCSAAANNALWIDPELAKLPYQPTKFIDLGLGNARVTGDEIENGKWDNFIPRKDDPVLVAYVRLVNVRKGDVLKLTLRGPNSLNQERVFPPFEKNRAQQMFFHGLKRPNNGWPEGEYSALATIERGGDDLLLDVYSSERKE